MKDDVGPFVRIDVLVKLKGNEFCFRRDEDGDGKGKDHDDAMDFFGFHYMFFRYC
jgi:hypothetical protein